MRETRYVHRLPVTTPTLFPAITTNVYLVENHGEAVLIDAGYDDPQTAESILAYIDSLDHIHVKAIIITHYHKDHSPGAKHLAPRLGCPVLCHPLEAETISNMIAPVQATPVLEDDDTIRVGDLTLRILHSPGHTPGHIAIWLEQEKILFTGDNIVGLGTTWIGPPDGDLIKYLTTLRRFLEWEPALIAPGHGELIQNPKEKIDFFIQRRLEREQQILSLLRQGISTVSELVNKIYRDQVHPSVMWVAERTVVGHLKKLETEKRILQEGDQFHPIN